jgi:hypothetical protein
VLHTGCADCVSIRLDRCEKRIAELVEALEEAKNFVILCAPDSESIQDHLKKINSALKRAKGETK